MSIPVQAFMILVALLGYVVAPVTVVSGWVQFAKHERPTNVLGLLSLGGFVLATASGLLAFGSLFYAQFHHFRFYDPLLMRVFRAGFLLSFGALGPALIGIGRRSSSRWFAPLSAMGTFAFWFGAAIAE